MTCFGSERETLDGTGKPFFIRDDAAETMRHSLSHSPERIRQWERPGENHGEVKRLRSQHTGRLMISHAEIKAYLLRFWGAEDK
jgi:hypothetical protein